MAGSTVEWERYLTWNAAVAAVVYPPAAAGTPVYLDMDDDVLDAVRNVAEPDAPDSALALIQAVAGTLDLRGGPSDVLRGHLRRIDAWNDGPMVDPPPTLALLALLSLVAESMHEGDGMGAHNYYGRLAELLELDQRQLSSLQGAYRRRIGGRPVSAIFWSSLNDWLESLEGNRGLPTAVAIGHEHIGFPLSQALVRRTEREKFAELFALNSLPPRSSLPQFDMAVLIGEWMARRPCPASNHLERLWNSSRELRERIANVALQTLAIWDGAAATRSTDPRSPADVVRAKAVLRSFPARRLEVGLVVSAHANQEVEVLEVVDACDVVLGSIELVPAASGYLGLADVDAIDPASFLSGNVLLRRGGQDQPLRRRAKRVVPMRYDDLLSAFVECERVQLGEEALLLVHDAIAERAEQVLTAIARPGFVVSADLAGVPDGWTLFSHVQVLSSVPEELRSRIPMDLNVLQPLSSSQVVLQGGLRLPGNIAKWSSWMPPELRASTEAEGDIEATISCRRPLTAPPPSDRAATGTGTMLIWDLAHEALPDGDYEITVAQTGKTVRVETLRLRSADNPAVLPAEELLPIAHDPSLLGFGLLAARTARPDAIRGARDASEPLPPGSPPSVPGWREARLDPVVKPPPKERLQFPLLPDDSCLKTGAHHMQLEMAVQGLSTVEGVCKRCGLVKRYPARRGVRKSARAKAGLARRVEVAELPPIKEGAWIDWRPAFDAVCHVGGGPPSALSRIASQMEATDLFGDAFERKLELLGHIEVERSSESLAVRSWEVVEPLVVGRGDGSAFILGFRSEGMMVALEDHVHLSGGTVTVDDQVGAPPVVSIRGLSEPELQGLADVVAKATRRAARYVPYAAEGLCALLPPLSQARTGLPTTTATSARSYEAWNPVIARFQPTSAPLGAGAFRLTNFNRTYIYRTAEDVGAMRATLGDARIVKYLAAADEGRSLLGYDARSQVLYVPLGADLPGLYGRAAVLASGFPPVEDEKERILAYRDVPPRLAATLERLLMS